MFGMKGKQESVIKWKQRCYPS